MGDFRVDLTYPSDIKLGDTDVQKVCIGDTVVWQRKAQDVPEEPTGKVTVSWDVWHYNVIHCEWNSTNNYLLEQTYNVGDVIVPPTDTWHSAEADKDLDDYDFLGWEGFTEGMIATEDVTFQGRFRDKNNTGEENDEVVIQWDVWDASVIHCVWSSNGSYLLTQTYRKGDTIVPPTDTYVSAESNKNIDDYELYEWEGYTQGMQATKSVRFQGRFRLKSAGDVYYDVNAYADPTDGGTVTGGGRKLAGTSVSLNATPSMNYDFEKWEIQVAGESEPRTSTDNPYTIAAISADVDAYAKFKQKQNGEGGGDDTDNPGGEEGGGDTGGGEGDSKPTEVYVTVTVNPAGGGTADGAGKYDVGNTITLSATANDGYMFVAWTGGGVTLTDNPVQFKAAVGMPTAWIANFAPEEPEQDYIEDYDITLGDEIESNRIIAPATGGVAVSVYNVIVYKVWHSGAKEQCYNDTISISAPMSATTPSTTNDGEFHTGSGSKLYRITFDGVEYTKLLTGEVYQHLYYFDGISATDYTIDEWAVADGGVARTTCNLKGTQKYGDGTVHSQNIIARSYPFEHTFDANLYCDDKYYDSAAEITGRTYRVDKTVTFEGEEYTFENIPFVQQCAFGYNPVDYTYYRFLNRRSIALTIHYRIRQDKDRERTCNIKAGPGTTTDVRIGGDICNRNTDGDGYQAYATEA